MHPAEISGLVIGHWARVVEDCEEHSPSTAVLLRGTRPVYVQGGEPESEPSLVCIVTINDSCRRHLCSAARSQVVKQAIESVVGEPVTVRFISSGTRVDGLDVLLLAEWRKDRQCVATMSDKGAMLTRENGSGIALSADDMDALARAWLLRRIGTPGED